MSFQINSKMNFKKVNFFGKDFVFQDKELIDPRIFMIKGIIHEKKW